MHGEICIGDAINWDASLNRGLASWWLALPGQQRGVMFRDLAMRNHGTLTSGPTWGGAMGRPGGCGSLSFVSGSSQYVDLGNPAAIQTLDQMSAYAWVKVNVSQRSDLLGQWFSIGSNFHFLLTAGVTTDKFAFYVEDGVLTFPNATDSSTYTLGTWYRVVGTYDRVNVKLYVDGVLKATTAFTAALKTNCSNNTLIGASGDGFSSVSLDDVGLMSRAWSASEVAYDYHASRQGYPHELNWLRRAAYVEQAGGAAAFQYMSLLGVGI